MFSMTNETKTYLVHTLNNSTILNLLHILTHSSIQCCFVYLKSYNKIKLIIIPEYIMDRKQFLCIFSSTDKSLILPWLPKY